MPKCIFNRSIRNPILKPDENNAWEANKLYNPGVIFHDSKYHLFYRAVNKGDYWQSSIGYASSTDGENFIRMKEPIMIPENEVEKRGLEDPRLSKIGSIFYMAYASYDGITPRLSVATSKDLHKWQKEGPVFSDWLFDKNGGVRSKWDDQGNIITKPRGVEWSKSGGIFPEKIDGKFLMLFGEYRIWFAHSIDGIDWLGDEEPFIGPRDGDFFDNVFIEMGPPPIKTDKGWLILYHGINKEYAYQIGFLILDLHDPRKIIYRSDNPIFWPQEDYELYGIVDVLPGGWEVMEKESEMELKTRLDKYKNNKTMPKVVFCCGATLINNTLRIFYGAGDSVICTAACNIDELLEMME